MLSEQKLLERRSGLGGTDCAAICGVSKWRTPVDVYLDKLGLIEPPDLSNNPNVYFGSLLEDAVAKAYSDHTGNTVSVEPDALRHPKYEFAFANIDRWVEDKEFVLECKTASSRMRHAWGEPGTDQIPKEYLLQSAWYAAVCNVPRVDIAVLIGGEDFRIYHYMRNQELEDKIFAVAENFWHEHVLKEVPPSAVNIEDNTKLYKEDNGYKIKASPYIQNSLIKLKQLKETKSYLEEDIKKLQTEIQEFMQEHSYIVDEGDRILASWKLSRPRMSFDAKRFKEEHSDLYNQYIKQSRPARSFLIKSLREDNI